MAGSRFASQAAEDALLKYQPQQSALQALMKEAEETYRGSVRGGESAARLGVQAVKEGIPQVAGVYNHSEAQNRQVQEQAQAALQALPGIANGYKAASINAGAAQSQKIAGNRASVLGQLQQQGVAAANSAASSRQMASTQLVKELGKLFGKSESIAGQQGAFASTEVEKLAHEAEKAQREEAYHHEDIGQREKASERTAATRENNSKRTAASKTAKGTELPLKEQDKAAGEIQQIKHFAGVYAEALGLNPSAPNTRAELVKHLAEGRPSQTVKVGETSVKHPGYPAFKANVLMSAALDWALGGYLSKGTEQRLQEAGYAPQKLGIPGAPKREATQRAGAKVVSGLGRALSGK